MISKEMSTTNDTNECDLCLTAQYAEIILDHFDVTFI